MSRWFLALASLLLVAVLLSIAPTPVDAQAAIRGPASERLVYTRVPIERAASALAAGEIDLYIFGLRGGAIADVAKVPGVKLVFTPTGLFNFVLNPAPVHIISLPGRHTIETAALTLGIKPILISHVSYDEATRRSTVELCGVLTRPLPTDATEVWRHPEDTFNPFCIREIRFALHYALDRDRIVREIFHGFAFVKYTHYGVDDPVYVDIADVVAKYRFVYDPDYVKKVVTEAMTDAGATLVGGEWHYAGKPVVIKALIRVEDERLDIGRAFALELIKLGFRVIRTETTFGPAIAIVYYTDPKELQWSYYTEGWGRGAVVRYNAGPLAQFGADYYCYLPGWCEPGYWNYKHQVAIDGRNASDYARQAILMNVKNKEEWLDALRKGTELAIKEAIRLWGWARLDAHAYRAEVRGITEDLGAGLRSPFVCRGIHVPGKPELTIGHLWVHTATTIWNPYRGFRDVYSVDPGRCTWDFAMWWHPFTAMPIEFRARVVSVETAGPEGKLAVPADAFWFDPVRNTWVPAHELGRREATSKVVIDYSRFLGARWHHGQPITWADILGGFALLLDAVYDEEKVRIEPTVSGYYKSTLDTFVALRIVGDTRLEIYVNYWHFEPSFIASWAVLRLDLPFEIWVAQDYAAFVAKTHALDRPRADRERIPWLSLTLRAHAEALAGMLTGAISFADYASFVTLPGGRVLMTESEWRARTSAVASWFASYGNLWISNGPFMVTEYSPELQRLTLTAFRDPTYPFGPTDWVFGAATPARVVGVEAGLLAVGRDSTIAVRVTGPGVITLRYLIVDPQTGEVIGSGVAEGREGVISINVPADITSKLVGFASYRLIVVAVSSEVAIPSEFTALVQAVPAQFIEQYEEIVKSVEELAKDIARIEERIGGLSREIAEAIRGLGVALSDAISRLGVTLTDRIGELGTTLESEVRKSRADIVDRVEDSRAVSDAAKTYATYALVLSLINAVLLLAVIALIFTRRS